MKMPLGDAAIVDQAKLKGYCLNPEHPRGKHKARVFAAVLGFRCENADELRAAQSSWIVRHGEDTPRLTSCFVKLRNVDEHHTTSA